MIIFLTQQTNDVSDISVRLQIGFDFLITIHFSRRNPLKSRSKVRNVKEIKILNLPIMLKFIGLNSHLDLIQDTAVIRGKHFVVNVGGYLNSFKNDIYFCHTWVDRISCVGISGVSVLGLTCMTFVLITFGIRS